MHPIATGPILIDRVYQHLLAAIADATLPPGQRIRQAELAERLGVSRQPVSHALHLLKRQGLVQESGRKGFEVAPVDPERIRQLYELRAAVDGLAARRAAVRVAEGAVSAEAAVRLRALCEAGAAMAGSAAMPALVRADVEFHRTLWHLSGNQAIEEILGPHWPHVTRSMAAALHLPGYRARVWAEHSEIADAVLAGDAEAAARAASDHAEAAGRATCAELRREGAEAAAA